MTVSTLPLVAAEIFGDGPFYAAVSTVLPEPGIVVWLSQPTLPPTYRWATDTEVRSGHLVLDELVVAELLYTSGVPADAGPGDVLNGVHRALALCHCDVDECALTIAGDYGDYPETAQPRMAACVRLAHAAVAGSLVAA